jgi:hypothetical protein
MPLTSSGYEPLPKDHPDFADLDNLQRNLLNAVGGQGLFEERLRSFFRSAIDEVIDTARTGRFFLNDLEKTEKTYLGTKFEILLRDWLQVPRGVFLDLKIGGEEVDVKSTVMGKSGWMIPPEAIDQLCILLRVNEKTSVCAVGLCRARSHYLTVGKNRDKKGALSAEGRSNIWWMVQHLPYTANFWSQISNDLRNKIMSPKSGTKRLVILFESCLNTPVSRVLISSVAAQDDFMKRLRKNGGARDALTKKGIFILYSESQRELMRSLGLKFGSREFVSFRASTNVEAQILRDAGLLTPSEAP